MIRIKRFFKRQVLLMIFIKQFLKIQVLLINFTKQFFKRPALPRRFTKQFFIILVFLCCASGFTLRCVIPGAARLHKGVTGMICQNYFRQLLARLWTALVGFTKQFLKRLVLLMIFIKRFSKYKFFSQALLSNSSKDKFFC